MNLDLSRSVQPTVPVIIKCQRCGNDVLIPAGLSLRIPASEPAWCHETVDLHTGKVYRRGNL